MVKPNFKGINRDINVTYALGQNIPLMFDIELVAPFNTFNLLALIIRLVITPPFRKYHTYNHLTLGLGLVIINVIYPSWGCYVIYIVRLTGLYTEYKTRVLCPRK